MITRVFVSGGGRQGSQRDGCGSAHEASGRGSTAGLENRGRGTDQGMWVASKSWKQEGNIVSSGASRRNADLLNS